MLTLSHGFLKPQTGDKGSVWFPALETNIQKLNDHTHNGTDSELLAATSINAGTTAILAANWVSLGGGNYRQLVTMPAGFSYDAGYSLSFHLTTGGHLIYPSVERVSATQIYVYINDNTQDLTLFAR